MDNQVQLIGLRNFDPGPIASRLPMFLSYGRRSYMIKIRHASVIGQQ